jgi:long-chain acyl-CoA synthetase
MLKRMANRGATGLAIVPAGVDVIRRTTGDALSALSDQLNFVELGSAPISVENRAWLMAMLPHTRLCHHYGMTEASRMAFTEYHADCDRPTSVGRASPNVQLSILDAEGQPAKPGETGMIVVSGDIVTSQYWQDPDLTAKRLSPFGFITGDLGRLESDGFLYLFGRQDDIINVGGRKVAPDEVETLLLAHPDVVDVACVAMPDAILGQAVKAHVVARGSIDEEAIIAWAQAHLEDYKVPRTLVMIDAIPRTDNGKIQRHLLASP